ncbi:MAG: SpoIIE family protein phosphatase [Cytophagales bacterium]|nr:SpoIIE family protein phosphatase [Cytophagales bacterium]MDW8384211.1 two-component regulator propeller domain-containing protein [Flammeovirgaceae bacterium]
MKNYRLIFIFIAGLYKNSYSQGFDPYEVRFRHISIEQGLSQSSVHKIIQDHQGFLWICTQDGLNKFDGYQFTVYSYNAQDTNSLADDYIYCVLEDANRTIWVGTDAGGLCRFDRRTEKFKSYKADPQNPNAIASNRVSVLYELEAGKTLLVGTDDAGLCVFDIATEKFTPLAYNSPSPNTLKGNQINCIVPSRKAGKLWIGTNAGFSEMDLKTYTFRNYNKNPENPNSLIFNKVWDIIEVQDTLFIATEGGLSVFHLPSGNYTNYTASESSEYSLASNNIIDIHLDREGILWLATENGIHVFDRNKKIFYRMQHDPLNPYSILNNFMMSIFEDNTGVLWFGSRGGGINYYDRNTQKFRTIQNRPGNPNSLNNNDVRTLLQENDSIVWIGTLGGGLTRYNRIANQFQVYKNDPKQPNSLPNNKVRSLMIDKSGNLWVGTSGGGLCKMNSDKKTFTIYKNNPEDPESISHDDIWWILEDDNQIFWLATRGGGLCKFNAKTGKAKSYKNNKEDPNSLPANRVRHIAFDKDKNLWISTSGGGLAYFDKQTEQFKVYKQINNKAGSLSNNFVNCVFIEKNGQMWVATYSGLNKFDAKTETFKVYQEKDGLCNDVIYGILQDDDGYLWLSTNKGLSKFDPKTEKFRNFDDREGLQSNEFNSGAYYKGLNGLLFFGGIKGFNEFNPRTLKENPYIPPVAITDFEIFNKSVPIGGNSPLKQHINLTESITLSYADYVFTFKYAALNYSLSEKNTYAYKLEGFDKDWNYVGDRRFATYTNIPGGEYVFRVKAANNDGLWNEEGKAIKIKIIPPFWETWWFRIFSFFALVIGGYTAYKLRVRSVIKRKQELERLVELRTATIMQQKMELEQQAEELIAANEQISAKNAELEQLNEEIAAQRDTLNEAYENIRLQASVIMSSINYAQTIQKAILPPLEEINHVFSESFVIYRPKDIVSGDFYWFSEIENGGCVAVVDCTGHGVPGAFMSMIGSQLLNEIVGEKEIYEPQFVLEMLDVGIIVRLKQREGANKDGMDICFVKIEKTSQENEYNLSFAGAKRPLYIATREKGFQTIQPCRRSIGGIKSKETSFTQETFTVRKGDTMFLTTDGVADLINPMRQSYGTGRLKEFLANHYHLPFSELYPLLEEEFNNFQQGAEQRDDVTLLGLRI